MRICAISTGEAARISAKDVLPFSFVRPGTDSRPRFLVELTCWRLVYYLFTTIRVHFTCWTCRTEAGSP